MGWEANAEKLLCLVVLADDWGARLSPHAGETFFRAFIVRDRATGAAAMHFRWRYRDGDQWCHVAPDRQDEATAMALEGAIESVVREASRLMGIDLPEKAMRFFRPPDDQGDFTRTICWM